MADRIMVRMRDMAKNRWHIPCGNALEGFIVGDSYVIEISPVPNVVMDRYAGMDDEHGTPVFMNDIVAYRPFSSNGDLRKGVVMDGFIASRKDNMAYPLGCIKNVCILGNIYDNPEIADTD